MDERLTAGLAIYTDHSIISFEEAMAIWKV